MKCPLTDAHRLLRDGRDITTTEEKQLNEVRLKKMLKPQINHASQISHMLSYCYYGRSANLCSYTVQP